MTDVKDIAWGKYQGYEGPYFRGSVAYQLPSNPTDNQKVLAVITSTEGGRADAINGYDRCIISVGYLQWCESLFLTSTLLGAIATKDSNLLTPLQPALANSNAMFKQNANGKWRFFFQDARGEVDTAIEQRQLFFLNASGSLGSWEAASTIHAKTWAACLANVLSQPAAQEIQVDFTAARVRTFAMPNAQQTLFGAPTLSIGWVGALRAAYLSFAANLPAVAGKHLDIALTKMGSNGPVKWSEDWCLEILKQLTFGPNIAIYPGRYNKIRPVLEALYSVNLPDFAEELRQHTAIFDAVVTPTDQEPTFDTVQSVQKFLSDLGYDLGTNPVDGHMGPKTIEALRSFQSLNGLASDGILGPKTRGKMLEVFRKGHP